MDQTKPTPVTEPPSPQTTPPEAPPQAVTQEIAVELKKETSRTSRSLIVMLLLVFPPIAWIFMWFDKSYHHWFIKILIVSGVITLLSIGSFYITLIPNMDKLYSSLGVPNTNGQLILWSNGAGAILATIQILFALYLRSHIKKIGHASHVLLLVTLFFLFFNLYVTMIGPILILWSVYQVFGAI